MTLARRPLLQALAASLAGNWFTSAQAQGPAFPSRHVTLLVPYAAGGLSDQMARVMVNPLSKALGQSVVVENLGGASGSIAAQKILNGPADGYTLFLGSPNELVLAPISIPSIKFKPEDFRMLQASGSVHLAILTRKDLPASNVDELVDYARKQAAAGKPITYASVGPGSLYHLLGEQLSKVTGIPMIHVPYKGGGPAAQDLLAGHVDIYISPFGKAYTGMAKEGRLKILALLNPVRSEGPADIPAVGESRQLKDFVYDTWSGVFVPKATPDATVQVLNKALVQTFADPAVLAAFEANSIVAPKPQTLEAAAKQYAHATKVYGDMARAIIAKN